MALHRDDPPVALAIRFTSAAFDLCLCFDRVLFVITGLVGESDRLSVP